MATHLTKTTAIYYERNFLCFVSSESALKYIKSIAVMLEVEHRST